LEAVGRTSATARHRGSFADLRPTRAASPPANPTFFLEAEPKIPEKARSRKDAPYAATDKNLQATAKPTQLKTLQAPPASLSTFAFDIRCIAMMQARGTTG
jgi:hypothetical protein